MENFFYEDEFYADLEDLMIAFEFDEDLANVPDDWSVTCMYGVLEPVFQLSPEWIVDRVDEERFSEDGDERERLYKVLGDKINYDDINAAIPKLWYPKGDKFTITKKDLQDWCA